MSAKPVLIAQISDLHIKPPGALAYGRVDTASALERCVAALNAFTPKPDLVVISGDLADTPTAEEYEYLKRLLAPLKLPFVGIPGNHDSRELMRAAFPRAAYAFPTGALNQSVEIGGLDLVLLDSSVPGSPHGELDAPTLQWLAATLASSPDRPALLFLHHPPFKTGIWHMDHQYLLNAGELAAVVKRHPRVQLIATSRSSRNPDDVRWYPHHDLPPRPTMGRSGSVQLRQPSFKVEPPASISTAGFRARGLGAWFTSGFHRYFDGPHRFLARWEVLTVP
jgi:3',5'-cyclic AMP phosphodiesterase CpdA